MTLIRPEIYNALNYFYKNFNYIDIKMNPYGWLTFQLSYVSFPETCDFIYSRNGCIDLKFFERLKFKQLAKRIIVEERKKLDSRLRKHTENCLKQLIELK